MDVVVESVIRLWLEYVTIGIHYSGRETVDVFVTEQFQMIATRTSLLGYIGIY